MARGSAPPIGSSKRDFIRFQKEPENLSLTPDRSNHWTCAQNHLILASRLMILSPKRDSICAHVWCEPALRYHSGFLPRHLESIGLKTVPGYAPQRKL